MPNQHRCISNTRYLVRSLIVVACGWLAGALIQVESCVAVEIFAPILAMLAFTRLDRHMLRPRNRLAERVATNIGQLLIVVTPLISVAELLDLVWGWQWPALWLALATAAIVLQERLSALIACWQPISPRILLAGDASMLASQYDAVLHMSRQQAVTWLNSNQAQPRIDEVVLANPLLSSDEIEDLLNSLRRRGLRLHCPPTRGQSSASVPALRSAQKRLFDILCATTLLFCCAPLMLVIALLVRRQDGGPALFRQYRLGVDGQCITVLKFRSMRITAGSDLLAPQARDCDPRITPLGHWIRYWGIDELPQLLNVLYGDMSMVGPRPHAVAHDLQHGVRINNYSLRRAARPGITGLAQIRGMRGEIRVEADMAMRVDADLEYIARQSLLLDLLILLATPLALVRSGHRHAQWLKGRKRRKVSTLQPTLNNLAETAHQDAQMHVDNLCEDSTAESA